MMKIEEAIKVMKMNRPSEPCFSDASISSTKTQEDYIKMLQQAFDVSIKALEKQVGKNRLKAYSEKSLLTLYRCSECANYTSRYAKYCSECGQKLEWSEE